MALRVKKTTAMHVDEGEYKAIVTGVQKSEGKFGEFVKWSFMIKDPMIDGEPVEESVRITGRTSLTLNPKSKLYVWCKACGLEVDGDDVDVEEALKKGVRIIVTDKVGNSGETISVVTKVMSLKKKKATVEDDEDEEEAPPTKAKKPVKVEEDEDEAPPPKKVSKKAPPKEEAEEEDEEEEEEEKPAPKKAKKAPKEADDDDEDEAPPKKSKKGKKDDDDLDDLFDLDDDDE